MGNRLLLMMEMKKMPIDNNLPAERLVLDRFRIDERQYAVTLVREAMRAGLLDAVDLERFQIELMTAVGLAIQESTGGLSSSVRTDDAQRILGSILYGLDLYLLGLPSAEAAVKVLPGLTAASLVLSGRQAITAMFDDCRRLLQAVRDSRISTGLTAYTDLIDNSFTGFFDSYDYRFDARNAHLMIDYPLLSDDMNQTGVIYVRNFLEHLLLENWFCASFEPAVIDRLLTSHGKKYGVAGSELLVNIAELLLKQALAAVLLGRPATDVDLDGQMCAWLANSLQALPAPDAEQRRAAAIEKTLAACVPEKPAAAAYLRPHAELFCRQLLAAARQDTLAAFLTTSGETAAPESERPAQPGVSLSDADLRLLIEQLSEIEDADEKVELILSIVQHPDDLTEILGAACLWGPEFQILFQRLGDYELAVLADPLRDHAPLAARRIGSADNWQIPENAADWQEQLIIYLHALESERIARIQDIDLFS